MPTAADLMALADAEHDAFWSDPDMPRRVVDRLLSMIAKSPAMRAQARRGQLSVSPYAFLEDDEIVHVSTDWDARRLAAAMSRVDPHLYLMSDTFTPQSTHIIVKLQRNA